MTLFSVTEYLRDVPDTVLNGLHIPNFVPENSPLQLIVFLFLLYRGDTEVKAVTQASQKASQQVSVRAWV